MCLKCICYTACLTCSRAGVPCSLTCSRDNVPCMLASSLANVPCVVTYSGVKESYVLTCKRALRSHVLTVLYAYVPTRFACFLARCYNFNQQKKFSLTCVTQIVDTFSLPFFCEIKLYVKKSRQAGISLETFILRIQQYISEFLLLGGSL